MAIGSVLVGDVGCSKDATYAARSALSRVPSDSARLGLVLPELDSGLGLRAWAWPSFDFGLGLHQGLTKGRSNLQKYLCNARDNMGQITYFVMLFSKSEYQKTDLFFLVNIRKLTLKVVTY